MCIVSQWQHAATCACVNMPTYKSMGPSSNLAQYSRPSAIHTPFWAESVPEQGKLKILVMAIHLRQAHLREQGIHDIYRWKKYSILMKM